MDSVPIAKDIERSLGDITKTAEDILLLAAGHDELKLKDIVLSPTQNSHLKFRIWQQNWSGVNSTPFAAAQALWGFQGWRSIQAMLNKILETSDHIGKSLDHISEFRVMKSRSKGKAMVTAQPLKQESSEDLKEIQKLVAVLSTSIDGVWIYSETVFHSLHDIIEHKENLPESENFLTLALQSRAGSLDLHNLCSDSPVHCCLEMDLLNADSLTCHTSNESGHPSGRLFYHLFAEASESPQDIKEIIVENHLELNDSGVDKSESVRDDVDQSNKADIQLFESQSGTGTKWMVSHHGSDPQACLFLPPTVGRMLLETKSERLAGLLATLGVGTILPMEENFSLPAKIELAYKIMECGFFLIGTPWFSSLSSKNIKRIRSLGPKHHNYMLEVQTLDHHDMLSDDPGALAETSHLFRIGIILMEIALDEPIRSRYPINNNGHDEEWISKLALIERCMGSQYCKATSFCLQYRQPNDHFRGPEKYHGERFVEWQSYLAGFLREYQSQVLLRYAIRAVNKYHDELRTLTWYRLQKLRDIRIDKERKPPTSKGRALGILMRKLFKGRSDTARSMS